MMELSVERIDQIMHKETPNTEALATVLRGVYSRYMHLYETYFSNIDALNDDRIAELKKYHAETRSLMKYYYLDIPVDVCLGLYEFDDTYTDKLLGPDWHEFLFDRYKEFKDRNDCEYTSEGALKAKFGEHTLKAFYYAMDYIFRDAFGTGSQSAENVINRIKVLLFGDSK